MQTIQLKIPETPGRKLNGTEIPSIKKFLKSWAHLTKLSSFLENALSLATVYYCKFHVHFLVEWKVF